jgi:RNA polymerase sigma factor (sigma-70 family)
MSRQKSTLLSEKSVGGNDSRQKCLAKIKSSLRVELIRNSRTLYSNKSEGIGIFCAFSKGRPWNSSKIEYWFAFHLNQKKFLKQFKNPYLTFICGSSNVLLIPFNSVKKDMTKFDNSGKLHVHILKEGNKFIMSSTGIELTQYILARPNNQKKNNYLSDLNPGSTKNFWTFYKQNVVAIEDILLAQISNAAFYLDQNDRDDLHQDVLCRLDRCKILSHFNPTRSAFNTFLTGTILGYIRNWLNVHNRKCIWRPGKGSEALRYERVFYTSLNGVDEKSNELIPDDLPFDGGVEREYSAREQVELLRNNLPGKYKAIFNLLHVGLSKAEIAENFRLTSTMVAGQVMHLARHGRNILKDKPVSLPQTMGV